ncbi:sensor domain-containing diguanylate cyclase [Alteromonas halophila]|uniref:diguanylate cyclase n=1 Tax=Alteromonas halophila TaxID=516698 RepID=A0A918JHQ2_9ALTE|nr:sensor domain-containing diguanylate cyclase [Alteromonas halophila]GGW80053.1 diguanylate cyclase [Alteromonas halophila]
MSETPATDWMQELFSSIEVGIVVLDRAFTVEVWNQFMENHSALTSEAVCGDSLFTHFPEIDEKWLRAKAGPVFDLNTPVFLIWEQRQYLFKFGSTRPVTTSTEYMYQNVTMFPLLNADKGVDRLCMLVYDVTDQALGKTRVEQLNEELKVMSRIDGLTGLYNRRYWQERFDYTFKLAQRRNKPITALMLDIDHFKKVNDTYGHQAGDKVIQALAQVIKKSVRETDLAGRYGGEEFAIILTDSDSTNATKVAERIRALSEAEVVTHEDDTIRFTVSLGLAEYCPDCHSSMQWLELADQALYDAKQNGRNQFCIRTYDASQGGQR